MTRGRLVALLLAVVVASLLAPALAGAQSTSGFTLFGSGGTPFSVRQIPVRFTGQLTVDFHGDPASGCAGAGLCGYTGTVSWRPPPTGALEIYAFRDHGRLSYAFDLAPGSLTSYPGISAGLATANVQLSESALAAPTSNCLDATATGNSFMLPVRHGRVAFTLVGASPSLLSTRCAGPLDSDVMPEIPAPTLPLSAVLRGRRAVSFAASHGFASHGFAGTVESTLTVSLGRPGRTSVTGTRDHSLPFRQIQVLYRATLSGSIVEHIAGPSSYRVTLHGEGGHAGAVLMPARHDAMLAGAEIALAVERAVLNSGSPDTVGTVGVFRIEPGAVNSVPFKAYLEIDLRDARLDTRSKALAEIRGSAVKACEGRGVSMEFEEINADPPAAGDPETVAIAEKSCAKLGLRSLRMVSRAYHDSLFMARVSPTTMIFIPCRNGWSHRPEEFSTPGHIASGVEVLAHTLGRLAA